MEFTDELKVLWEQAPLSVELRQRLGLALETHRHKASLSNAKNLENLLQRLDEKTRMEVNEAIPLKRTPFYQKLISTYKKECELRGTAEPETGEKPQDDQSYEAFASEPAETDAMEVDTKVEDPAKDTAFAAFAEEADESEFDSELREAREALAAIKAEKGRVHQ